MRASIKKQIEEEGKLILILFFVLAIVAGWLGYEFYGMSSNGRLSNDDKQFYKAFNMFRNDKTESAVGKVFEIYTELAEKGHYKAQNNLGSMYENGEGTEINYEKAFLLYQSSFYNSKNNWGKTPARNIGEMYREGKGVEKDIKQAIEWYKKSVNLGDRYSLSFLGYVYYVGYGTVPKDIDKAIEWFEKGAAKNDVYSLQTLASIYMKGEGVPKNVEKAETYINMVLRLGTTENYAHIARLYYDVAQSKDEYIKAGEFAALTARKGSSKTQDFINHVENYCYGDDPSDENYPVWCYFNEGARTQLDP